MILRAATLSLALLAAAHAEDVLFLKNGVQRVGRIAGFDGQTFRLEVVLSRPAGAPTLAAAPRATVSVPRADVERVEFTPDPARDRFLQTATTTQAGRVGALWTQAAPLLAVPRSPAGRIGVVYADLLLATGKPADVTAALALFRQIESEAWSEEDRAAAGRGRLRAMIASGDAKSAVAEALALAKTAEDPSVLIEARFILGRAADDALHRLVAENPRWRDDPAVIPEHARLFNEALDHYLHPALFFGSDADAAARGLGAAVDLYRFVGDTPLALETARDILAFYPATPAAEKNREFLAQLTPEQTQQDYEKEARDSSPPAP